LATTVGKLGRSGAPNAGVCTSASRPTSGWHPEAPAFYHFVGRRVDLHRYFCRAKIANGSDWGALDYAPPALEPGDVLIATRLDQLARQQLGNKLDCSGTTLGIQNGCSPSAGLLQFHTASRPTASELGHWSSELVSLRLLAPNRCQTWQTVRLDGQSLHSSGHKTMSLRLSALRMPGCCFSGRERSAQAAVSRLSRSEGTGLIRCSFGRSFWIDHTPEKGPFLGTCGVLELRLGCRLHQNGGEHSAHECFHCIISM
jgi:hypothetical protein